jgi:hypothetical protein
MVTIVRKFLAGLSAVGIAVSIVAYIESLSGTTVDDMLPWVIVLLIGAVAIQISTFVLKRSSVLERSSLKDRVFFWRRFARGMPRWVGIFVKLLWVIVLAHFVWFFIESHGGVPVIQDGQWILSNRGRIVKVLTQTEYLTLKADELRVFAIGMITYYLVPMMYWWFPRNHQEPGWVGSGNQKP